MMFVGNRRKKETREEDRSQTDSVHGGNTAQPIKRCTENTAADRRGDRQARRKETADIFAGKAATADIRQQTAIAREQTAAETRGKQKKTALDCDPRDEEGGATEPTTQYITHTISRHKPSLISQTAGIGEQSTNTYDIVNFGNQSIVFCTQIKLSSKLSLLVTM
jgi:hypothetical protein